MKRYTVIIANASCPDLESFDTLEQAYDEIGRQRAMDACECNGEPDAFEFRYAVRDNAADAIVWVE